MRLTLTTAAAELPVSVADAKKHCRVEEDDTEDDLLIEGLIGAATGFLDGPSGILGRAIITQVWLLELPSFPTSICLPLEPVQSVEVSYLDGDGAEQDLAAETYELVPRPSRKTRMIQIDGSTLPALHSSSFPVRISMTAGFGAAADVPPDLLVAIKMLVAFWYEHREALVPSNGLVGLPLPVSALLARWRILL